MTQSEWINFALTVLNAAFGLTFCVLNVRTLFQIRRALTK